MKVHHRILVQALSKLAIISCIIPSYDFKTKRLTHRLSFKIYSIFFTATVMSLSYVTFVCRKNELFPSYNIRYVVNSIVETTEIVMFVVTTLGASFWNMETWERLVGQSSRLERDISTRTSFKFQPSVFLIAGTAYDAILTVYHLYRLRWDFFRYYSVLMFLHYTRIICMYLICYMVRLVEHSYRNMNEILVHISLCSLIKGDTLEKLKKVEEMYMKTDRIINIFNRYFGWILLLTFSQVIGRLLLCLAIFIQIRPNILFCSIAEMWEAIILNISYTGMTVVGPITVIFACDAALREADKLSKNCYKLQEVLPLTRGESRQLQSFQSLIQNGKPFFTAGDFFEINRSNLFSLIGTTTTYMIVILQFDML